MPSELRYQAWMGVPMQKHSTNRGLGTWTYRLGKTFWPPNAIGWYSQRTSSMPSTILCSAQITPVPAQSRSISLTPLDLAWSAGQTITLEISRLDCASSSNQHTLTFLT